MKEGAKTEGVEGGGPRLTMKESPQALEEASMRSSPPSRSMMAFHAWVESGSEEDGSALGVGRMGRAVPVDVGVSDASE